MEKFISTKAKVSSKGWVVIPKDIRDILGIKPGDEVRFTYWPPSIASGFDHGRLHVRKVPADPVAASAGMIKRRPGERPWTETLLEERRVDREARGTQDSPGAQEAEDRVSVYVLDSYAIIAHYLGESGAVQVRQLLHDRRHTHWMTEINLGEVFYKLMRERSNSYANEVLEDVVSLPIRFADGDRALTLEAASLKGMFPLSYADCFAAALTQRLGAKFVTGDEEFQRLEQAGIISVEWLPPKPKARRR